MADEGSWREQCGARWPEWMKDFDVRRSMGDTILAISSQRLYHKLLRVEKMLTQDAAWRESRANRLNVLRSRVDRSDHSTTSLCAANIRELCLQCERPPSCCLCRLTSEVVLCCSCVL